MGRLIDADELMEILRANRYYPFGVSIDEVPTVDAVQVIRCKDCKHWSKPYGWNGFCEHGIPVEEDDYCSHAERKEE